MKKIVVFSMTFIFIMVQFTLVATADYTGQGGQSYNITKHTPQIRSMDEEALPKGGTSMSRKALYTIVGLLLVAGGAAAAGGASTSSSGDSSGKGDINIEW